MADYHPSIFDSHEESSDYAYSLRATRLADLQPTEYKIITTIIKRAHLVFLQSNVGIHSIKHQLSCHGCASTEPNHDLKPPQHSVFADPDSMFVSYCQHTLHTVSTLNISTNLLPGHASI